MILIDTSIWISFFNSRNDKAGKFLEAALLDNQPLCINAIIEMEILQGIADENAYRLTKNYLVDFQYFPFFEKKHFDLATDIFRACRKKGITIRKSLDCLIASNCLLNDLQIVHRDRDFENIKKAFKELRTYQL